MKRIVFALLASTLVLWGLAQDEGSDLTVNLLDAETLEQDLGTVTFAAQDGGGVVASFDVAANDVIAGGEHAIHIHQNGDCGPADSDGDGTQEPAGAAGGHFNPTDVGHGEDNGPHVGDSAEYNYAFADDGSFTGDVVFPLASLDGDNAILREGGVAIMVHEGSDDMETDPSGQSGPRIACGALTQGE